MDCDICGFKAGSKYLLKKHKISFHEEGNHELVCDTCGHVSTSPSKLARHKEVHVKNNISCPFCPKKVNSQIKLRRHIGKFHGEYVCNYCPEVSSSLPKQKNHITRAHTCKTCNGVFADLQQHNHNHTGGASSKRKLIEEGKEGPRKAARSHRRHDWISPIYYKKTYTPHTKGDIHTTLARYKPLIFSELRNKLAATSFIRLKYHLNFGVIFFKDEDTDRRTAHIWFNCGAHIVLGEHDFEKTYQNIIKNLEKSVEQFSENGSNWKFQEISEIHLEVVKYNPQRPASYIELPEKIKNKTAVINVKNNDNFCFLYSIGSHLKIMEGEKKNLSNVNIYNDILGKFNIKDLNFPLSIDAIRNFQKQNPSLPPINVYGLINNDSIVPVYISEKLKKQEGTFDMDKDFINLLILEDDSNNSHYCYISNFQRLFSKKGCQRYICPFCLQPFAQTPEGYKRHQEHMHHCQKEDPTRVICPKNKTIKFTQIKYMIKSPVQIYADTESILKKCENEETEGGKRCKNTNFKSEHVLSGYCLRAVSPYFKTKEDWHLKIYRGEDASKKFAKDLEDMRDKILAWADENGHAPIPDLADLTIAEQQDYYNAKSCWICKKGFLPDSHYLPTKVTKQRKQNSMSEEQHLDFLEPFLDDCGLDNSRLPSMREVKKTRQEGLKELHPDKGEGRNESDAVKREKEEKCKRFIKSISAVLEYMIQHGLHKESTVTDSNDDDDEEEMDIDEILRQNNISKPEFTDFKNRKIKNMQKVLDHCHFTGQYRGAAHSICNLKARVDIDDMKIPVWFHNFSGYDSHHILKCFAEEDTEFNDCDDNGIDDLDVETGDISFKAKSNGRNINVLAKSFEKIISLHVGKHLILKDSLNFLPSSLDGLVQNISKEAEGDLQKLKEKFPITYQFFKERYPHLDESKFHHLTRKGVYPYSYFDSHQRFEETSLPARAEYRSDLTKEDVSDEDFEFSRELWTDFDLKNLGELHDLYMATDVHLLADVFERFRDCEYQQSQLDPAHFYSLPSLSWTACLKMTRVKLQILDDIDMCLFIDRALTGGIALIGKHYAEANNIYLKNYDASKPTSWIMNFDCTNQYGWAMSEPLPTGGFKWDSPYEWDAEKIMLLENDSPVGYFFEVDLDYPNHLHDKHDQYPFGPEKIRVTEDMLSEYQKKLASDLDLKTGGEKLLLTLNSKKNYVCHGRQLKQMLKNGLILKKVHKALRFSQSAWLKPYIEHNTNLRKQSKNKFDKDCAKLRNNSVFGKTCEDVRKYIDVKIVLNPDKALKYFKSYKFKRVKKYGSNMLAIEMRKEKVELNKPRYIGAAVLNISKTVMYDFAYYYMDRYPGSELCFTDTDSLCFHTPYEKNIYEDMKDCDWIDFSNYPPHDPTAETREAYDISHNYSEEKKLVPGYFKDDMGGKVISAFIGLRAKMYMIKTEGGQVKSACKGVSKTVKEKILKFEDYHNSLFDSRVLKHDQSRIGHKNHTVYTMETCKVTLCPFNDKKYVKRYDNNWIMHSHGHFENEIVNEDLVAELFDMIGQ